MTINEIIDKTVSKVIEDKDIVLKDDWVIKGLYEKFLLFQKEEGKRGSVDPEGMDKVHLYAGECFLKYVKEVYKK